MRQPSDTRKSRPPKGSGTSVYAKDLAFIASVILLILFSIGVCYVIYPILPPA